MQAKFCSGNADNHVISSMHIYWAIEQITTIIWNHFSRSQRKHNFHFCFVPHVYVKVYFHHYNIWQITLDRNLVQTILSWYNIPKSIRIFEYQNCQQAKEKPYIWFNKKGYYVCFDNQLEWIFLWSVKNIFNMTNKLWHYNLNIKFLALNICILNTKLYYNYVCHVR